ncbi:hypothetical protein D3C87_102240 [compost metagenome]
MIWHCSALASKDEEQGHEEETGAAFEIIQNALNVLRKGGHSASGCEIPESRQCSFSSYCESFQGKSENIYLYENSEGRKIPNFAMMTVFHSLEQCMRSEKPETFNNDPFLYPEKFQSKANEKIWMKEKQRVQGVYEDTKKRLLKILASRKDGKNNARIEMMMERVRTVRINMPDVGDIERLMADGCESPNAFYGPEHHTLILCPQTLNLPDASLMSTVAHELGHSIDPCHCAQDLVKTKDGYQVEYAFDSLLQRQDKYLSYSPVVKGVGLSENPLGDVLGCLQSSSSIGVKSPTITDIQAQVGLEIAEMRKEKVPENDVFMIRLRNQQKNVPENYDRYGACEFYSENGHIGEAFSDWASAQVLADKVKEIPESSKAKQFVFESQALFMGTSCNGLFKPLQAKVEKLLDSGNVACGGAFFDYDSLEVGGRSHPASADRMTKVIYAQPELQKALGCQPGTAKACQ